MTQPKPYPPRAQFVEISIGGWLQQGFESPDSVEFLSVIEHDAILAEHMATIFHIEAEHAKVVARYEKIIETVNRALLITANEPESRTQEANHYNWLDEKNAELERKLKIAERALEFYTHKIIAGRVFERHVEWLSRIAADDGYKAIMALAEIRGEK